MDKDKEVSELGFAVDRGAEVQLDLLPVVTPAKLNSVSVGLRVSHPEATLPRGMFLPSVVFLVLGLNLTKGVFLQASSHATRDTAQLTKCQRR